MENGDIVPVDEEVLLEKFGQVFVNEVKELGQKKFVPVPVGSSRQSVMGIIQQLIEPGAPTVRYMQGEMDTCVFSSFATALYSSGDVQLKELANKIQQISSNHEGIVGSLEKVKRVVDGDVKWLQPKWLKKNFVWQEHIGCNDFFVGIIRDNTGSVQHTVSVHNGWIFDSNEPYALPLNKQSLDCCTWEVMDGKIKEYSEFLCFEKGILFISCHKPIYN